MYFPVELWQIIVSCLFHNISLHGKHLENTMDVKAYNKVVKCIPLKMINTPLRVIYTSRTKPDCFVKFVYYSPFMKSKRLIIEYQIFKEHQNYMEQYFQFNVKN